MAEIKKKKKKKRVTFEIIFFFVEQTLIRTLPHWRAQDTSRENMDLVPTQGHHITFVNQKMRMMHSIELKGS